MTTLRKKGDFEQSGQGQTLKVSKLKRSKFAIERVRDIARFLDVILDENLTWTYR